jgi:perosamine synthetase
MTEKINELILTAGPSISELEIAYVLDAAQNGWNWHHSDYLKRFEQTFRDYIGANHAIPTSSCTGALHLALLAMGIGEGDEVIVPELTWIATASAVTYVGATPVFCDVDSRTWSMSAEAMEKRITPKTKAIMPVHLYGHPCDMDEIMPIAEKHGLKVIEDAAQSIGSEYKGRKTGSFGDAASFSFQGAKALVTGEGGMLMVKDQDIYERAVFKGDHGRDPTRTLYNIEIGYKYKMSNIQAALGLAQIERVDEIVDRKIQIFKWYQDRLGDIAELTLNDEMPWAKNIFWMSSIVLDNKISHTRDEFIVKLKERNIDTRPIFYPISHFPMFEEHDNPNAYHVGLRGINLPSGHDRTEEEVNYICQTIRDLLGKNISQAPVQNWLKDREDVRAKLAEIKEKANEENNLQLERDGENIGYLKPLTRDDIEDADSIKLLSNWRRDSQIWFPTQFNVTEEGTKKWLQSLIENQADRVLYFVCTPDGDKVGHVGFYRFDYQAKSCELDNIVRGQQGVAKGIMEEACRTLIEDGRHKYGLKDIYLRVFSDNEKAVRLYERLNFEEIQRVPMFRQDEPNGNVTWMPYMKSPYEKIERYFTTMKEKSAA